MRTHTLLVPCALVALACAPIRTASFGAEGIPKGSPVTLHVMGSDRTGLEHALSVVLRDAGYAVHSSNAVTAVVVRPDGGPVTGDKGVTDTVRRYPTRYACVVRASGNHWGVSHFTIQLLDTETGRILHSVSSGRGTSYSPDEVAQSLRKLLS